MKITLKVFLAVVIFCSAALAGDQGAGGCTGDSCPPPPCTANCGTPVMGDGGNTSTTSRIIFSIVREGLRLRFVGL